MNNTETLEKDCIWGDENSVKTAIIDSEMIDRLPAKILGSGNVGLVVSFQLMQAGCEVVAPGLNHSFLYVGYCPGFTETDSLIISESLTASSKVSHITTFFTRG